MSGVDEAQARPRPRQLVRGATLAVGSDRAWRRHGPRPQTARARPERGWCSLRDDLLALHETRVVARRTCRVASMRLALARRLPSCHGFLDLRLSDPRRPNDRSAGNDLFRQSRQQPRDRCRPAGEQLFMATGSPSPCELFMNTVHHRALSSLVQGSGTRRRPDHGSLDCRSAQCTQRLAYGIACRRAAAIGSPQR